MAGFRTRFEDLPAEFAVFPLPGALLLPRGRLPLNIFEPRYVAMIEDSLANGRMFGDDPARPRPSPRPPTAPPSTASAAWAACRRSARPRMGAC